MQKTHEFSNRNSESFFMGNWLNSTLLLVYMCVMSSLKYHLLSSINNSTAYSMMKNCGSAGIRCWWRYARPINLSLPWEQDVNIFWELSIYKVSKLFSLIHSRALNYRNEIHTYIKWILSTKVNGKEIKILMPRMLKSIFFYKVKNNFSLVGNVEIILRYQ